MLKTNQCAAVLTPGILSLPWRATVFNMSSAATSSDECTDAELVAAVLTDAEQYAVLMQRYEAPLDRYIRRLGVRDLEDRQDVLQNIFIKAYRNLNQFDQQLKFSSWIYRIAHNEAVSWHRRRVVRPEGHLTNDSETVLAFLEGVGESPDQKTRERLNAAALSQALASLPQKYRDVIVLRFFEHKEYDEISDILRIPTGTVGTLLHRGKARLRRALTAAGIDVDI